MTPCGECARAAIFVQAAEVERDHDKRVIHALQQKIEALEETIKKLEKKTDTRGGRRG
jgi:hypothetical protein